jgi:hypothetical protein
MKPIPKRLLIHSATIKAITSTDRWGTVTTTEPINLKFIRLEPTTKIVKDKQNNEIQLNNIMFYDCKNSIPRGLEFAENTIITINKQEHTINVIESLYDANKLHHYELGLS